MLKRMNLYNCVTRGAQNGVIHLHLHGAHKADKSPEKHSQQLRGTYRDCFINEDVIGKVPYIQPLIKA